MRSLNIISYHNTLVKCYMYLAMVQNISALMYYELLAAGCCIQQSRKLVQQSRKQTTDGSEIKCFFIIIIFLSFRSTSIETYILKYFSYSMCKIVTMWCSTAYNCAVIVGYTTHLCKNQGVRGPRYLTFYQADYKLIFLIVNYKEMHCKT